MYRYPSDDTITDAVERRQDAHKRLREASVIQAMLGFPWHAAMDFGCGRGRNLPLLHHARPEEGSARVLAIDADGARLEEAKAHAQQLISPSFRIDFIAGGAEEIEALAPAASLDLILYCQVLTHMPTAAAASAMESFARLLKPGGALIVCVPFHNTGMTGDYFHEVDLAAAGATLTRRRLSGEEFDRLATSSLPNRLAVRAFHAAAGRSPSSNAELPFCIEPPQGLHHNDAFSASTCLIYSVHEYSGGKAAIGDLALKLIRRGAK
jgi:SAM-dependent methyltransferase